MENTLAQIYNTLATIDTHGEGTLRMAMCLNALEQVIKELQSEDKNTEESQ